MRTHKSPGLWKLSKVFEPRPHPTPGHTKFKVQEGWRGVSYSLSGVSGAALLAAAAPIKERHDGSNHSNCAWKEHGVDSHHSPTNPIAITRRTSQIAIPAGNRRADSGPPPTNCPSTRAAIVRFASSLNVSPIADLCALLNRSIVADSGKIVAVGLQPETSTCGNAMEQSAIGLLAFCCRIQRRKPGA
jgi:hypothetical protein